MDHGDDQGRRALTLAPDVHVRVARADQVASDLPAAVAAVTGAVRAGRPAIDVDQRRPRLRAQSRRRGARPPNPTGSSGVRVPVAAWGWPPAPV
ncbi:MAG TPA: hypothetical protein VES01_08930 [Dermatophilaceae bacterium]|nr:hypothetical protein [Dermatophilaceae bacterium]